MTAMEIKSLELSAVESPKLRRLHEVWRSLQVGGLPDRSQFHPELALFLLGQICLIEVVPPETFRLRLVGTRLEDCGRRGDQGRSLEQIQPQTFSQAVAGIYREVVATGEPKAYRLTYTLREGRAMLENLVMPFTRGGDAVAVLLEGADWPAGMEQNFLALRRSAPELRSA